MVCVCSLQTGEHLGRGVPLSSWLAWLGKIWWKTYSELCSELQWCKSYQKDCRVHSATSSLVISASPNTFNRKERQNELRTQVKGGLNMVLILLRPPFSYVKWCICFYFMCVDVVIPCMSVPHLCAQSLCVGVCFILSRLTDGLSHPTGARNQIPVFYKSSVLF